MTDITFTTVRATLGEPAMPLARHSAFEHVARLMQRLRQMLPHSDNLAVERCSGAQLCDLGLRRPGDMAYIDVTRAAHLPTCN